MIVIGVDRATKPTSPQAINIERDKQRLQKSPKGRRSRPNLFFPSAGFLKFPGVQVRD